MDTSGIHDALLQQVLATAQRTRDHCDEMLRFIDQHKQQSPETNQDDLVLLAKYQKSLTAYLSVLRGQHRSAVYSVRESKSSTAAAKAEIDSLHLQLQNLFYEQRHLRGEIQACEDYPHSYERLSLVPAEEFVEQHQDLAETQEHDLMIARIKDEHEQRRRLEKERLSLVKKKTDLAKQNQKQKY